MNIKKVCVFCASSPKIEKIYFDASGELGKILAENAIEVNYGGGAVGLMGELADSVMRNNGKITGIIPLFMKEKEWAHKNISQLVVVKDMHERKRLLIEGTDAVIALPGGIGTLEELAEVIALKQLGQYLHPVIILNTKGFYDEFLLFLTRMIQEKFMHHIHQDLWVVVDKPSQVLNAISTSPLWDKESIRYASFDE